MTTFQVESVASWELECGELTFSHWQELGMDLDLEIAPDFVKMSIIEANGMFKVITVREDGKMVGYLLAIINQHLHYRHAPSMLMVDAYYVSPTCRTGTGVRLIRYMERLAKELGAIKIYITCKVHKDHSKLFTAMGYRLSDFCFIKRI